MPTRAQVAVPPRPRAAVTRRTQPIHWLVRIAREAGLQGVDALQLPSNTQAAKAWAMVVETCHIAEDDLARHAAAALRLASADVGAAQPTATKLLPASVARSFQVVPLRDDDRHLFVATSDPLNVSAEEAIGFASGRKPVMEVAGPTVIAEAIATRYSLESAFETLLHDVDDDISELVHVIEHDRPDDVSAEEVAGGPVVKLWNLVMRDAVRQGASDIHMQPGRSGGVVRFRVDGLLRRYMQMPLPVLDRLVSRTKVLGAVDITTRLQPQDGRTSIAVGKHSMDLRISTVPTRDSEKAVIRLLDPKTNAGGLDSVGLLAPELSRLRRLLSQREGIVVVTGPTGSGKTTTLYSALRELSSDDVNIMTVEDPIEYQLSALTQIQVEPKQGVTFASALRAILRQDPDIIFVGEIRDLETAEVAVQASLTGHLVLATLHTNDAAGAVRRLTDIGLDRSAIVDTLRGALAQRLVRRICRACAVRVEGALTEEEQRLEGSFGLRPPVRAVGCDHCAQTGYRGRLPVVEVFQSSQVLADLIADGASSSQLNAAATAEGMRSLRDVGLERARSGETTLAELERVLGAGPPRQTARGNILGPGTAQRDPADRQAPSVSATAQQGSASDAVHVLVVDDEATGRTYARMLLEKEGYRVSEAPDGVAALEQLKAARFELVILDLDMPRLGGRDVLRRLRASITTAGLPVVVFTGTNDPDAEIHLLEAGADDYLRKPVEPRRFMTRGWMTASPVHVPCNPWSGGNPWRSSLPMTTRSRADCSMHDCGLGL